MCKSEVLIPNQVFIAQNAEALLKLAGNIAQVTFFGMRSSMLDPFGLSTHKLKSRVHVALDVIGFIPGIGDFADLVNAGIYFLEDDVKKAIMSGMCVLPLVGEMAGGAKIMSKAPKAAKNWQEC